MQKQTDNTRQNCFSVQKGFISVLVLSWVWMGVKGPELFAKTYFDDLCCIFSHSNHIILSQLFFCLRMLSFGVCGGGGGVFCFGQNAE